MQASRVDCWALFGEVDFCTAPTEAREAVSAAESADEDDVPIARESQRFVEVRWTSMYAGPSIHLPVGQQVGPAPSPCRGANLNEIAGNHEFSPVGVLAASVPDDAGLTSFGSTRWMGDCNSLSGIFPNFSWRPTNARRAALGVQAGSFRRMMRADLPVAVSLGLIRRTLPTTARRRSSPSR